MPDFAAMPFWTDAYLADCGHLDDAEHGRYVQILIALWRAPKQRLPNDDDWLAHRFRRTVERVRAELRPLIAEFCQSDDNWITQKRLTREFEYVTTQAQNRSNAAKARETKKKNGHAVPHPHPTATASAKRSEVENPSAIPSPVAAREGGDLKILKPGSAALRAVRGSGKYAKPENRDAYAREKIVAALGGDSDAHMLMMAAETPGETGHDRAVARVREVAALVGVGWISPEVRARRAASA
jgi:uncharacterized protein YdaU (DUF1376 family)